MEVILVDANDQEIGVMEKMEAHKKGALHRAFSVFIFNEQGEMLIHQRAMQKYHNGGLWTNACCSHPMRGEQTIHAASRRLKEEMGIITELVTAFSFTYKAEFDNGLIENEFDHVFIGTHSGEINPDPAEVQAYTFKSMKEISQKLTSHPGDFTIWFRLAFPRVEALNLKKELH